MMMPNRRILVVDDEADVGELICAAAQGIGFQCTATTDATTFLAALRPDTALIMLDLMMPEMDGIELLRLLGERKCETNIVLMSGVGKRTLESAGQLAAILGLNIVGHLQKPFRLDKLEEMLARHVEPRAAPILKQAHAAIQIEELRAALDRQEIILHYQPQIDLASRRMTGVEALVRWQHPERGLIFPDDFINRTEELGLIDELGWLVAERGMSEVKLFASGGGRPPMLSVNASTYSLLDLRFPETLLSLAAKHGVAPCDLTIELTETGLIKELSRTLDILIRLRMKQVNLSIDDFGTGYAMMEQLRNIPATELKIDKSFVQNMQSDDRDRIMVRKTIEMGHELGMRVIAEGVETPAQLELLRLDGCDCVQGYLFSRPLPPKELISWLQTYNASIGESPLRRTPGR
jgi:EAL domain-containing protein (putative c-di-GMP-specific phosphodiesterase class I)